MSANSNPDESINYETDVTVHTDGRTYAGNQVHLTPGESIHIQQYLYYDFEVEPGAGLSTGHSPQGSCSGTDKNPVKE